MEYLIGLDIGTSAVKGVLMSADGRMIASLSARLQYHFQEGLKVLQAEEFCNHCFHVIRELAAKTPSDGRVYAICSSGASGNLMFFHKDYTCSDIIGWQNAFDGKIVSPVLDQITDCRIYEIVGWPKLNSFPLAALAHYQHYMPNMIKDSAKICMHIEYLNYILTGCWGITLSMGTPFYLINQETGTYEHQLLELFDIKEHQLPEIFDPYTVLGHISEEAGRRTGLSTDTKVVLGTFDHPSAARGANVIQEDQALLSCGTSWVLLIPYKDRMTPFMQQMLIDPFCHPSGNWAGMVSIPSVSEEIEYYKKKYLGTISYEDFDSLADQSIPGCNGFDVDADVGADAYVDDVGADADVDADVDVDVDADARAYVDDVGLDVGLDFDNDTGGYSRSDAARAIIEKEAHKLRQIVQKYAHDCREITIVGGIANSKVWIRVLSEIINRKIVVNQGEVSGAVGSAIMAGIGIGLYKNEKDFFSRRN